MDSDRIRSHLCEDLVLKKIIDQIAPSSLHRLEPDLAVRESLIFSVIGQQLSVGVAKTIKQRFMDYYQGKFPSNPRLIHTPDEDLRKIGLSWPKMNYIKNIAHFFHDRRLKNEDLVELSNEELLNLLTQIKGVGAWTVEMVLIFCLGRHDVMSLGDYGLQLAVKKLYNLDLEGKALRNKMQAISQAWIPFRTYACLYLWAFKDGKLT